MASALPVPDVYLSERVVLCETKLSDDHGTESVSSSVPLSACDVLQLAARKAVGCAVGDVVEAEPSMVLSPDCKHLAVKEPCSRRICLLSAQDGFKEVLTTLIPKPVAGDGGEVIADTVLSCSWSADSKFLLVACKSSAVYLYDSTGRLLCEWDTTWSWAQLQLVAACHGPGSTILILTAARVVFLVAHNGDKLQRGSCTGSIDGSASSEASFSQQQLQFRQQQILEKYSVKRYHTSVSAIGYDDKSGLLVVAGDSGSSDSCVKNSSSSSAASTTAAAFAAEGVTVSVWQLQERQLHLRFALGTPQGGPGILASMVASALGVDRAAESAAAATLWSVVFSPLLEYVALLTRAGSVYLLSLTENCLVDPASGFAGRSATPHGSGSGSSSQSPTERSGLLRPKHISLTPLVLDAAAALSGTSSCNRAVAWWGPRVLAVAAADGSVSLVRLPESVNILGAAPVRFAAGARVVANHSGSRGLLVVEPISAALASAAAGTTAAGQAVAAVASSLQRTAQEAMFAADASAAVGFSAVLAAKRNLAAAATAADLQRRSSQAGNEASEAAAASTSRTTAWLAKKLSVSRDELQAAAASGVGGAGRIAGWRLVLLAERTPQQLVQVHLRLKDWGSALGISRAYGLDTDTVYLARWAASPVSRSTIADNLPKIKSRRAVVTECLTRVAPDYESARLLISYGLRETAKWAAPPESIAAAAAGAAAASAAAGSEFATPIKGARRAAASSAGPPATPGGLSGPAGPNAPLGLPGAASAPSLDSMPAAKAAEVRWWRLQRLKLLALHDRLETCMALKHGSYDPEMFSVLRTEPLPKAAAALAAAGNVAGLTVLLQRHKSTLALRLLQLLSALPESVDPRFYASLIPRASAAGAAAAAAGPDAVAAAEAAAGPRVTRPVGVGNIHAKGLRKVDWVESEETFKFLAAAAAGTSTLGSAADHQQSSADSATQSGGLGSVLSHAPSLDAGPGLPIPVERASSRDGGRQRLSSAGSLDMTSWALCADESAVMMHATEELERYCSFNGANKRTLPTDTDIARWLASRALQLDAATGQLPDALQLLDLAVDKGYGQFMVQIPTSTSTGHANEPHRAEVLQQDGHALPSQWSSGSEQQVNQEVPNGAVASSHDLRLKQLQVQGSVLLQLVKSWWPLEQQQAQDTQADAATAAAEQSPGLPAMTVAETAAAALQPLWSVTLQQWVSAGLLPQLLAVLSGSSRDLLQQDLQERVLPLLQCYPHDQQVSALQHVVTHWLTGTAAVATGSSNNNSSSGGISSSIMLAVALVSREAELLQAVAAAAAMRDAQTGFDGSVVSAISSQQRQQMLIARAASGELAPGQLVWGGDVAALVTAVLTAVRSCTAANQWARIEQLLDAAEDALAAAAAVNGLEPYQQHSAAVEEQKAPSSASSDYGSAVGSEATAPHEGQQQAEPRNGRSGKKRKEDGWGEDWSSEDGDWQDAQQQEAAAEAAAAAAEPLRAALLEHAVGPADVQQLQTELGALRGQVRAARLLTKHGCSVSIEQVSSADSTAVQLWLAQLLARAERLGASWPESQWAQVWHDLLEAQQSGLSARLPSADLAAAFLRVLLLVQQYHLAVQFLPACLQQQLPGSHSGTPTAGTPRSGAFAGGPDDAGLLYPSMDTHMGHSAAGFMSEQHAGSMGRMGAQPATAETALAALTGGGGGGAMFPGSSRFGVRRALHNAAGAAVSTAVGGTAKLMGVSAHLVGSTAHLVGHTAQAVQGAGGVMGATAGLVSGTASLVSTAATFAAEAAAKAGNKAGLLGMGGVRGTAVLKGAQGLLSAAAAEAVVVAVSQELLAGAASLADPAVVAAEAVLQLLPPDCKAAAEQRDAVAVLRRLPEFGVSLLPAQLTSLPDKHQLLQRILFGRHTYAAAAAAAAAGGSSFGSSWDSSSVPPWRRLGDVLELAALLGFGSQDEQNEVRLMAAEAALTGGEVGIATYLSLQLAAVRYAPAWRLAAELACPQRYTAQRQQRADTMQQLAQQEHRVQQQLQHSQPDLPEDQHDHDATSAADTRHQQSAGQDTMVKPATIAEDVGVDGELEAGASVEIAADGSAHEQQQRLQLRVTAGDRDLDASTASIASPATPGADAAVTGSDGTAAAAAVAAAEAAGSSETIVPAGEAAAEDIPAADVEDEVKSLSADAPEPPAEASLQAPATPHAAVDPADASAMVVEAVGLPSKAAAASKVSAQLDLPRKDRQKLLAFAAAFCPSGELPALTDELVLLQHSCTTGNDRMHTQQRQQQQELGLLMPLQQQTSVSFQTQRQQLLQTAVAAAAATTVTCKGQVDPYTGLFSFGDPYALLAVLLSSSSPADAQQLLDDVLTQQLTSSSDGSRDAVVGSSLCCLQRLLVVGAAAQLLLLLQQLPQDALVEVVASVPSSRENCGAVKLPHQQELLLQLLHVPLGKLQSAASMLLQRPPQQQVLPAGAADVAAVAAGYVARLQQIADGRQLLQWLPGIETGRFFAGDKPYQEQVLIQLASKAGQMAVQPVCQQQQPTAAQAASAEALMTQAQQLAASYGADPFQLELWYVHSLILYAPDITAAETQALLAAHTEQLLQRPATAAAHLYSNTYPLLPAAAAEHCACVLGLIHAALVALCRQHQHEQQQQQQAGTDAAHLADADSGGASVVPSVVSVGLPQLERLKGLLVKGSKPLAGLAAKALIGGHVALMLGPAVAAAAAWDADTAAGNSNPTERQEAAVAAAAAAVAGVDLPLVLLEANSAVAAFVTNCGQATVVAKFIRHLNTLAEQHARASVGDKPKQQLLFKLVQGVSAGLPHLLLLLRTMSSSNTPDQQQQQQQQQQRYWADAEERSEGLTRTGSADSFQSAVSASSSLSGANAHAGHHPAAALAIEWATARARYASNNGRQQLLNCSALQLSALAGWLALGGQQPLPEEAVGQLRPLAMGPGLQLQVLTDVIMLITSPDAALPGLSGSGSGGGGPSSSGGSSRSGSFHQSAGSAEAAATAAAVVAALGSGPVPPPGAVTLLMRDDPAAIAGWRPPSLPASLAPKRRELVTPLLQAAVHIVARNLATSAVTAAAAAGPADVGLLEEVAALVSQQAAADSTERHDQQQQQQPDQGSVAGSSCLQGLLRSLVLAGHFPAMAALQLVHQLASLQASLSSSIGAGPTGTTLNSEALSDDGWARQGALTAVSAVVQQLAQSSLDNLQQQLTETHATDGIDVGDEPSTVSSSTLKELQLLVHCLVQSSAAASPPGAAAAAAAEAAGAAAQAEADDADSGGAAAPAASASADDDGSWISDSIRQLRDLLWQQVQQYQAQLPAEAYGNRLVAELLELQESISTGSAWSDWHVAAGGAAAAAAAACHAEGAAGGRPTSSGAGLLLARTMTALGKQFPGLKACADDVSSVQAAVGLFSSLVQSATPLSPSQFAALTNLLTDVWKEGAALPQAAAVAECTEPAAQEAGSGAAAEGEGQTQAADTQQQQQQQEEAEALAQSVGLPVGTCQVSQLHSCWLQLLSTMLSAGNVQGVLALLDKVAAATAAAAAGTNTSGQAVQKQQGQAVQEQQPQEHVLLLVTEAEAEQVVAAAGAHLGPAGQVVTGLLLPYKSCQQAAVDKLLQGKLLVGSREPWAGQLLLLLLLRGQLPQLAAAAVSPGAGQRLSGAGNADQAASGHGIWSEGGSQQQQQLYHLYSLLLQPVLAATPESSELAWAFLTCLFPHAVSQLCLALDYAAAAALVAAKMRACGALCTFNGGLLLLQRYLEVTMQRPWQAPSQQPGAGSSSPLWLPCCEAWMAASGASVASTAHTRLLTSMGAHRNDG